MDIRPYSPDELASALSNKYTKPDVIKTKNHFDYFLKYLGENGLNAQSIVIEENYISKDFLQDYASYYAFCFEDYPKFCKRIHFFRTTINEELIKNALLNKNIPENWWDDYLGLIVVKPIPTTVIGFSVLKNYNAANHLQDRHFWGVRDYKIHFFGKELSIPTLAFQEQDSVLAACATTAIWSMLNKASTDFHTILKTPSQITRDADNVSPDGSRLFPNKGLSVLQICRAIFNSGLVSEVKQPDHREHTADGRPAGIFVSNLYTKKILNAYSKIGIPIILVIRVPDGQQHGLHAITVSGYKQTPAEPVAPKPGITWHAENIDRIYAHDDQWGPFARVEFQNEADLITPWTQNHTHHLPTKVTNIIVPVYPKIRISYEDIEAIVLGLDAILTLFFDKKILHDLVWDIKIDFSESFKTEITKSSLEDEAKINLLTKSLPKYLWIATCYIGKHKVFEFTFDATDVNSGMIGEDIICYLPEEEKKILCDFLQKNKIILEDVFSRKARLHYYHFVLKELNK